MNNQYININFLPISQPIGKFYCGIISWKDLLKIANADIRKIHQEEKKNDSFDSYLGIQRKISPSRIKEIGNYVTTVDATFPTSIILHIESEKKLIEGRDIKDFNPEELDHLSGKIEIIKNVIVDDNNKSMMIRADEKVARILDGQHRIEGLRDGFERHNIDNDFEFNVTIFVDLDIDDQAQIFSIINKAQTKVNKSLVYDLFEYARSRSPQKTAHDIVRILNRRAQGPFYKKIKILGTAEDKEKESIAQATFVELIISFISSEPEKDRDILKRNFLFKSGLKLIKSENDKKKYVFRNLFIEEKDEVILSIINNYFKVVQNKWPNAWEDNDNKILAKSTGLIALMRFLRKAIVYIGKFDVDISESEFKKIFDQIKLDDTDFVKETYIPGSSGQSQLLKDLVEQSNIEGTAEEN